MKKQYFFLKSNYFKATLGLILSLVAVYLIIVNVDLNEVWVNLRSLPFSLIIVLILLFTISIFVRANRWRIIINQKHNITTRLILKALVYGTMLNQLLPVKIGEIARAEYITQKYSSNRSFFLISIAIERLFDMIIISIFFVLSIFLSNTVQSFINTDLWLIPIAIAIIVFFIFFIRNINILRRFVFIAPKPIKNLLNRLIDNLIQGIDLFSNSKNLISVFFLSLFIWSLTIIKYYLIIDFLNIEIPYYAYFFLVSAGIFGMIIPSTSANMGVYHAVAMSALMLFMVDKPKALSFAILAHAFDFFPAVIYGGVLAGYKTVNKIKRKQ